MKEANVEKPSADLNPFNFWNTRMISPKLFDGFEAIISPHNSNFTSLYPLPGNHRFH
jgi:hypothetical protein